MSVNKDSLSNPSWIVFATVEYEALSNGALMTSFQVGKMAVFEDCRRSTPMGRN